MQRPYLPNYAPHIHFQSIKLQIMAPRKSSESTELLLGKNSQPTNTTKDYHAKNHRRSIANAASRAVNSVTDTLDHLHEHIRAALRDRWPGSDAAQIKIVGCEVLRPNGLNWCMICTKEANLEMEVLVLPCGDWFHIECVSDWLDSEARCPICSRPAH